MLPQASQSRQSFQVLLLFCLLFVGTSFVNKYVLSVLKFTYPTIFQGWQTLVGAILLRVFVTTGHLDQLWSTTKRSDIAAWLPGMMMFVISIYAGSRALANLAVPVFFSLQNLTVIIKWTGELAINRQMTSLFVYGMLMLLAISSVAVVKTDPQFSSEGYFWMVVHILSTGCLEVYTSFMSTRLKLSSLERLFSNYIYSVVILAPSSYFLGDALEARRFPYLYFAKFYIGCILSGVFGMGLSVLSIRIQEDNYRVDFQALVAVSKMICSLLSLAAFSFHATANQGLWLTVNHLCALAVCDSLTGQCKPISSDPERSDLPSHPNVRRDSLQQDLLRTEVV